ncbi:MAG: cadmium-translocating P-type ATPase [Desulfobacter sp.]|nr:MAG: cadmium-translocating P-type ATPase [Desulfobacter sp.]
MIGRHSDLSVYKEIFKSSDFIKIATGGLLIPVALGISKISNTTMPFVITALLLASVAINGIPIVMEAIQGIMKKKINVDELVSIAIIACLANGNFLEAATVSFIMVFGSMIEEAVSDNARKSIQSLIEVTPDTAILLKDENEIETPVSQIAIGDHVLVRPGEVIPVDGSIFEGQTAVDESSLTGESIPANKYKGDDVCAGTLNLDGFIRITAQKIGRDSTIGKVIGLVKSAEQTKVDSAQIVDKYAAWFTPFILSIAILTYLLTKEIDRAIAVLIVGCPCSFLLAGPVTSVAAIGRAAKAGILVKGGQYLERIAAAKGVFFDKTGTLTTGAPQVVEVIETASYDQKKIIELAARVELGSKHPLATGIVQKAKDFGIQIVSAQKIKYETGVGISGMVDGKSVRVEACSDSPLFNREMTFVTVLVDTIVAGHIGIFDQPRPEARQVTDRLKRNGLDLAVISGDHEPAVKAIAEDIHIETYHARLKPGEKMKFIQNYQSGKLVYIGDGINDAPALKAATA